jgi:hypothetical protein
MADLLDDLERLRLGQSYADVMAVEDLILEVPVRKPKSQTFVRVHPDPEKYYDTALFKQEKDGEYFLVEPTIQALLEGRGIRMHPTALFLAVDRQNTAFLWPVRIVREGESSNTWWTTAQAAVVKAKSQWIQVSTDMDKGAYNATAALGDLGEPHWPDQDFEDLLKLAFKDRQITDRDHPIVTELEGRS